MPLVNRFSRSEVRILEAAPVSIIERLLLIHMRRMTELLSLQPMIRLMAFCVMIASLHGCATSRLVHEEDQSIPQYADEKIEQNQFPVVKGDDVIGRLRSTRLEKGDTLPDIARHFNVGLNVLSTANPGMDIWVPKAGERIILPMSFILPDTPKKGIVINLASMRLFQFKENGRSMEVFTYPVGVGTDERPSPMGQMSVVRKVNRPTWYVPTSIARDHLKKGDPLPTSIPPGPDNPLGDYALYLSRPSYLIHGTNKMASIGLRATNGCIRLFPESIQRLFESTPVKTPVNIVNQPYLLGESNGVVYLEIHASSEASDAAEFDRLYAKLKELEKKAGRTLDWNKVKKVLAEARGIPVPIFEVRQGSGKGAGTATVIQHPHKLYGKPDIPKLKADAWAVLAAEVREENDAVRLAAIINHQGPHIPARVIAKSVGYHVIAGPFNDIKTAKDIIKRLKIDLELDSTLIEPVKKR